MRQVMYVLVSVLALALACGLAAEWLKSFDEGISTPLVARSAPEDRLTAVVWVSRNRVRARETFAVRVTFLNRTVETLRDVRVEGFLSTSIRVTGAQPHLVTVLAPGARSRVLEYSGVIDAASGQHSVAVLYSWTDKNGRALGALTVGPMLATTPMRSLLMRIGSPILGLFRDLALPIVLAIGAWFLQRLEKARDDDRKRREDDRAEAVRLDNERRSQTQTAWSLMLPVSHELNTLYYLPVLAAVDRLVVAVRRDSNREQLFYLLSVIRRMRRLTDDKGGLFLKDVRAERVVGDVWNLAHGQVSLHFDLHDRETVIRSMTSHEDYATFAARFEPQRADPSTDAVAMALGKLETAFKVWRGDFEQMYLPALRLFGAILLFELNQPFSLWYDAPLPFPASDVRELAAHLAEVAARLEGQPTQDVRQLAWRAQLKKVEEAVAAYLQLRATPAASPADGSGIRAAT